MIAVLAERNETAGTVKNRSVAITKGRDDEEGQLGGFDLRRVAVGMDDDGDAYYSCIVVPNGRVISPQKAKRSGMGDMAIMLAFSNAGGVEGGPPISIDHIKLKFARAYEPEEAKRGSDRVRQAWNRVIRKLPQQLQLSADGRHLSLINVDTPDMSEFVHPS